MNEKKWNKGDVPYEILLAKLAEECGEVAHEMTTARTPKGNLRKKEAARLDEELTHVIFIALCYRNQLRGKPKKVLLKLPKDPNPFIDPKNFNVASV